MGSAAVAQQEGEAYCQHLLNEIAIKRQSLNGLTYLVNGNVSTLLSCDLHKTYVNDYAQIIGAPYAEVQQSFAAGEGVANKIRYGGVIDGLQFEIADWQAEHARACAGSPEPVPDSGGYLSFRKLFATCPEDGPIWPTLTGWQHPAGLS